MGRFLLKVLIVAVAIAVTAALLPGIEIDGGAGTLLWVALLFTVVNLLVKPIALLISLPLIVVSLGLFAFVVNAAMLGLTAWLTDSLAVDGFWTAIWGSLLISLVVTGVELVLGRD